MPRPTNKKWWPIVSKPLEYICQIDSDNFPLVDTTWSITDGVADWFPLVSTAGVLSVSSGGTALNTPYAASMNGLRWLWFITSGGIISVVSTAFPLTTSDSVGALVDADGVTWLLIVGLDEQLYLTTETPLENKFYYPSILISFTTSDADDIFELHAIKPNTTRHRR